MEEGAFHILLGINSSPFKIMISEYIIKQTVKRIKEKEIKALMCGFIYVLIIRKNHLIEKLRYTIARMGNRMTTYYKIIINDSLMYIDFRDNGISKELYVNKKREPFSTDFMKKIIREDDIVIDIGANIGYYVLLEAQLIGKGRVYAIEPIPTNRTLLEKNIELNLYKNVCVFNYAIGDRIGKGKMYIYNKGNWCSFIKNPNETVIEEKNFPIITLDSFIKEHLYQSPTFIRMDVEGYECQIIRGMPKLLEEKKPLVIFMELHPPWLNLMSESNTEEIIDTLKRNGFKVKAIFLEPVPPCNNKDIILLNKLRKIMGLPEFGLIGESYGELYKLLDEDLQCIPMVFFERYKEGNL